VFTDLASPSDAMLCDSLWHVLGGFFGGFAEIDDGGYVSNRDSDDLQSLLCNSLPGCLGALDADWHTSGDDLLFVSRRVVGTM